MAAVFLFELDNLVFSYVLVESTRAKVHRCFEPHQRPRAERSCGSAAKANGSRGERQAEPRALNEARIVATPFATGRWTNTWQ